MLSWPPRSSNEAGPSGDSTVLSLARLVHREMVLLVLLVFVAGIAFAATRLAAQASRSLRLRDAVSWYERGLRELDAGRAAEAATALRRAAAMAPDTDRYRLALARALTADGQHAQARLVLLRLRERQPEDPDVDLALARLEADGGDPAGAIRYYQHALAALWSDRQNEIRPLVRLELIEFLLRQGQRGRALSELLVLSPTAADDAPTRTKLGRLFLQAGDSERAMEQFTAALRVDAHDAAALAGAGEAAFNQGQYTRAWQLLARAPESFDRVDELRAIVELVITRDPLASRLAPAERLRRLAANAGHVHTRLSGCAGSADGASLRVQIEALRAFMARRRTIARDAAEDGMALVARGQQAAADACGLDAPLDRALLLIARRHELLAR